MIKKTLKVLLLIFFIVAVYEVIAVIQAKSKTEQLFKHIIESEHAIQLSSIPEARIKQLLKIEDPNFYEHKGVDFTTPGAGLTTITQAMVKYLYFEDFSPGFKKIEQTLIAKFAVNEMVSKQDQLSVFFTTAYLGTVDNKTIRGFSAAAETYFNKSFQALSEDEYLALVAMLIGPEAYSIINHPEKNKVRVERIKTVLSGKYVPKDVEDVYYRD